MACSWLLLPAPFLPRTTTAPLFGTSRSTSTSAVSPAPYAAYTPLMLTRASGAAGAASRPVGQPPPGAAICDAARDEHQDQHADQGVKPGVDVGDVRLNPARPAPAG